MSLTWRVHATLDGSVANGPGRRFVVWVQGCTLACPGCFNPWTHGPGGDVRTVERTATVALGRDDLDGVTLTGGEPLQQPEAVAEFCARIRPAGLGIIVLTGFTRREIEDVPARRAAVAAADMVVAGRYNAALRTAGGLRGSANKDYWALTGRYSAADLRAVPEVEIDLAADGTVTVTGTPRARWS